MAREAVSRRLRETRGAIVEIRGGAGWGKSAAMLVHAAQRQAAGSLVVSYAADGMRRASREGGGDECHLIDDSQVDDTVVAELLARVQVEHGMQIVVGSRVRHALVAAAMAQGLLVQRVDLSEMRLTAQELQGIALVRGLDLDGQRAEYIVRAVAGWPLVAVHVVNLCAEASPSGGVRSVDALVTRSYEEVLGRLVGIGALPMLARASLASGVRDDAPHNVADSRALRGIVDRIHALGLGEWIAA